MSLILLHDLQFEELISEEIIVHSIQKMGEKIRNEYILQNPLVLVVLNGAFVFGAELMKHLNFPLELDFVRYRSYKGLTSAGEIQKSLSLPTPIKNRHVLLVEDIVDTGLTLSVLKQDILEQNPSSLKVASLIFKPLALKYSTIPDFFAFETQNTFLVGFGLDYNGLGRNLRSLYTLKS